jgi:Uma2 family endonuclease
MSSELPGTPVIGSAPGLASGDSEGSPRPMNLPTHLELPAADGKPVENAFFHPQSSLLTLTPVLDGFHTDGNYFVGADTGIYWRIDKEPLDGCKAPDWFYVPNVPRLLDGEIRRSYVLWEEFGRPLIVIEFVSGDGSEEHDGTPDLGKFWVYENAVAATHYLIWDRVRLRLEAFELWHGRYRPTAANERGRYPVRSMEVEFGIWEGAFMGYRTSWLRAWDRHGRLLPTTQERAETFAARLRELGVDPDSV